MYKYRKMKEKAILTEYLGDETIVNIPNEIDGLIVSKISSMCFFGNDSIEEIHFPSNVSIENNAIVDCSNLKSVYISSVNRIGNIMEDCENATIISESSETINKMLRKNIEKSSVVNLSMFVTKDIGEDSLMLVKLNLGKNDKMTDIVVPDFINGKKLVCLYAKCFAGLTLNSLTLNNFITVIPTNCFNRTTLVNGLFNIENIREIDSYGFYDAWFKVNGIFESLESVGEYAFGYFDKPFEVGNNITNLEPRAFYNSGLISLYLPKYKTELPEGVCEYCEELKVVELPKKCKVLPERAFARCQKLEAMFNANYIEIFETECLNDCESLDTSNFKFEKATSIKRSALSYVTLPKTLKIGGCKFEDYSLEAIKGVKKIVFTDSYVEDSIPSGFCRQMKELTTVVLNKNIKNIREYAFYYSGIKSINLEDVERVEDSAFYHSQVRHIKFGKALQYLGSKCFSETSSLISMDLQETNITVLPSGFLSCSNVSKLYLPNTLEKISARAFASSNIKELNLNEGLKVVSAYFLSDCKIKKLTLPASLEIVESLAFYGSNTELTFLGTHVTFESKAFENYTGKTLDLSKMTFTSIKEKMFDGIDVKNLILSDLILEIGDSAFQYAKINKLTLNYDKVLFVRHSAFYYANIGNLKIATKAKCYNSYCYYGTKISSPDIILENAEKIHNAAFCSITGLENVTILGLPDIERDNFEMRGIKSIKATQGKVLTRLKSRVYFKRNSVEFEKIK